MRMSRTLGAWVSGWALSSLLVAVIEILFSAKTLGLRWLPGEYLVSQVLTGTFIGLLIGLIYVLLFWLFVERPHRSGHLFAWSFTLGLALGVLFVGGWTGFLCAVYGRWPHGHTAIIIAEGISPYILGGCAVGWLQTRRGLADQIRRH